MHYVCNAYMHIYFIEGDSVVVDRMYVDAKQSVLSFSVRNGRIILIDLTAIHTVNCAF